MNNLIKCVLLGSSFVYAEEQHKHILYKSDNIEYKVPEFFKKVCSGKGIIVGVVGSIQDPTGYYIYTSADESKCPSKMTIDLNMNVVGYSE